MLIKLAENPICLPKKDENHTSGKLNKCQSQGQENLFPRRAGIVVETLSVEINCNQFIIKHGSGRITGKDLCKTHFPNRISEVDSNNEMIKVRILLTTTFA